MGINNTALNEFRQYIQGFLKEGEGFVPNSSNNNLSVFMEYFNSTKRVVKKSDNESFVKSLLAFKNFIKTRSKIATKEDYYSIVDELAKLMPDYVKKAHPELRQELIENSGQIFKWQEFLGVENKDELGNLVKHKFFNQKYKTTSLQEFSKFVEKLTGKKVLIGSPTRMDIGPNELGLLNDPNSYKNIDYILLGHGTGSSLISDTKNPKSWKFSDNGKSIWEFIETHIPKGKKVLVGCCEKDGLTFEARKELQTMYDKSGKYMYGIGEPVSTSFISTKPAKICESGKRHIIGHSYLPAPRRCLDDFINSAYGNVETVYYNL